MDLGALCDVTASHASRVAYSPIFVQNAVAPRAHSVGIDRE